MTEEAAQPETVRVLLADDQRLVRESLGTLLGLLPGINLVASASDGEEALALVDEHNPAVVLMDLRMPRVDGIEATRRLRERRPDVRVIALTTYADNESVLGALRAGARGYLTKDAGSEDIRTAILSVAAGEAALDPSVQHHVIAALADGEERAADSGEAADSELPDDLTPREAEVLVLIAEGLTNAEIAQRLFVSPPPSSPTSTTCSPRRACATAPRRSTTPTAPESPRRLAERRRYRAPLSACRAWRLRPRVRGEFCPFRGMRTSRPRSLTSTASRSSLPRSMTALPRLLAPLGMRISERRALLKRVGRAAQHRCQLRGACPYIPYRALSSGLWTFGTL